MKTHRSPFENLRANGATLKMIEYFPFVLRLVEAFRTFFSNLLGDRVTRVGWQGMVISNQ